MRAVNLSHLAFLNFGRPLYFGGGGGGSPQSPPDTPMPVRDDPQSASEQAARVSKNRKGMAQTLLSDPMGTPSQQTLGTQTILGGGGQ